MPLIKGGNMYRITNFGGYLVKKCKKNRGILLFSKKSSNFAADLEKINLIILRRYERNS